MTTNETTQAAFATAQAELTAKYGRYVNVKIAWSGKNFDKAVSNARRAQGKYNSTTKLWQIPTSDPVLVYNYMHSEPKFLGWQIVSE